MILSLSLIFHISFFVTDRFEFKLYRKEETRVSKRVQLF